MYKKKLLSMGIPADLRGFEYLNYAIEAYHPPQGTMSLYQSVGDHYGITKTSAERDMRNAVQKSKDKIPVGRFVAKYKILWEGK